MTARERMTDEELAQIKERAEKATEGNPLRDFDLLFARSNLVREDIPKLLAEIERLRESLETCKKINSGLTREVALLNGEKPITVKLNGGDSE